MHIALKFGYDGRKFNGYARQPQQKTVEGNLIKSLIKNGFIEDTAESNFKSASRTDKGVSALGNVVSFITDYPPRKILKQLNEESNDIIIYGYKEVKAEFYPRYAIQRRYRYYLKNEDFNFEKITSAAILFTGEYNYSNFAKLEQYKDPVRKIDNIIIDLKDDYFIIDFFARTFLWNQIRRIISAIKKMATEKIEKEQILEALHNPDKKVDYGLSSADSLLLIDIIYDFKFEIDNTYFDELKKIEDNIISSL
jgi:tRNA pseudouridine38-40 synthase